jgi:rhamnose transport system permease protein
VSAAAAITRRAFARWEALLIVLILAAGVWSWTLSSFFLRRANLLDLATPYIFIGLAAFGLTFVVIAGEIDISVMSIMAVAAVSIAEIWSAGVNVWLAALAGLGVAVALGLVNGLLVGLLDLPSLAVTLGTLAAFRGLAYVILGGSSISGLPTGFTNVGGGYISNELPDALLVLLGFALVLGVLLHATRFGRYLYTIGSAREVARFSGVPVARVRVTVFALSGLMAGFAAIVYLGFFGSVQADAASGSELIDVVTAVVLDRRSAARADPDRGSEKRHAARQPGRRHPGHGHRRAPCRSDSRRQRDAGCAGPRVAVDQASTRWEGGDARGDAVSSQSIQDVKARLGG